jgi:hypothetical protein
MHPLRSLALVVVLAFLAGLGGCITPSIPIPPPSPERMTFELDDTTNTATFAYPAEDNYADAIVYIYNRTLGEGIITTADAEGRITTTPPFPAELNNEIAVTIEAEAQTASTCVVLRASGPVAACEF